MNKTVWLATSVSTVLFIIVGWLGALAFSLPPDGSVNILQAIESNGFVPEYGVAHMYALAARRASCTSFRRSACIFSPPWCCSAASPLPPSSSATTSFSLVSAARVRPTHCSHTNSHSSAFANFWAVLFPWFVAAVFYTGSGLQNISAYPFFIEAISYLQPDRSPSHVDRCCHQRRDQLRHPAPSLHLRREQRRYDTPRR